MWCGAILRLVEIVASEWKAPATRAESDGGSAGTGIAALDVEVFIERPDGSRLPVLANFAALRDARENINGVITSFVDITERKQAEETLRELSDELEKQLRNFDAVVSSVPDFIYSFDLSGRFTFVNQPLLDLWQKTFDEAVGKDFHDLDYPPALAKKLQHQIQKVIKDWPAAER